MKHFITELRWNLGVFILRIGYKIRQEIPQKNWDWLNKIQNNKR